MKWRWWLFVGAVGGHHQREWFMCFSSSSSFFLIILSVHTGLRELAAYFVICAWGLFCPGWLQSGFFFFWMSEYLNATPSLSICGLLWACYSIMMARFMKHDVFQATRMSVGGEQTETTNQLFLENAAQRPPRLCSSLIVFTLSTRRPQVKALPIIILYVEGLKIKTVLSEQTLNWYLDFTSVKKTLKSLLCQQLKRSQPLRVFQVV